MKYPTIYTIVQIIGDFVIIYLIENVISGKQYVGQTRNGLSHRWNQHLKNAKNGSSLPLHNAIRKYGSGPFKLSILQYCISEDDMNEREIELIRSYNSLTPIGYNILPGGVGGSYGEDFKMRVRQKLTKYTKPVVQFDPLTGNAISSFSSLNETSRVLGLNLGNLGHCVKNPLNKTMKGFGFAYKSYYDSHDSSHFIIRNWKPIGKRSKSVIGISDNGNTLEYSSIADAIKELGVTRGSIVSSIRNGHRCKGYRWNFKGIQLNG